MKITVLITTYNRPAYLKRCLDSIKRSDLKGASILISDDCSTDLETKKMIYEYNPIYQIKNKGICASLLFGLTHAFISSDIVINLDSDAIVRNDWMEVLLNLHHKFPDKIITGFHSTTKNKDGTERHKILNQGNFWALKQSVGGINMLFTKETFEKYAKPALEKCIAKGGNWDHQTCINAGSVICAVPSIVQHIGIESSLGHTHDRPDVADDFKYLKLPNVTLVCVDDDKARAERVMLESSKQIEFGDRIVLPNGHKLGSKEAYSDYILKNLYKHIVTDYALIVQHDGYVKNPEAWTDEFLNYDYIGAPWWYKDEMNVGNGGFSLRSKKLLEATAKFFNLSPQSNHTHPEDHQICRTYRNNFEKGFDIKFAPVELASKFSFEGYMQPGHWDGQFGFHGDRAFRRPPDPKKEGFIINQFLGLGDILFLVPLIRKWMSQGHDIIWPVADEYFNLKEYFPDIQFVRKSSFPMNYDNRTSYFHSWKYGRYRVRPLRWNMCRTPEDAMTSKYDMVNEDWKMWRELKWARNYEKEKRLAEILGVNQNTQYAFIVTEFGNVTDGGTAFRQISPMLDLPYVYLQRLDGFNLLDWAGIIENATEIHAVSSSTFYLFEVLNLKAKEIHLYSRKLGQRDFDYITRLMTKKYVLHV